MRPEGLLTSLTQPETGTTTNGTTSFEYDSQKRLYRRNDSKGQRIQYEYDGFHRLQYVRRYPVAGGPEDTDQRTTYVYGSSSAASNAGRLIQIQHGYKSGVAGWGFNENFSYNPAGLVLTKSLTWVSNQIGTLAASYTYDPEGRLTGMTYPTHYVPSGQNYSAQSGRTFTYTHDAMGRPASMLEGATPIVSSVSYNPAGQITAMTRQYQWDTESRTYNLRGQLTRQTGFGVDISYGFSSTANDGRIQEREDHISGEKVQYQYDQLGRLIRAETTNANWGLAWNYDGFGNLTQQSVIKGSLTGFTLGINAAKNRIAGQNYDANGNWTGAFGQSQSYDVDNRVRTAASHYHQETYVYSARNERIVSQRDQDRHRVHFYGADGLLLGIYTLEITQQNPSNTYPVRIAAQERIYFGGRLMQIGGEWVATDRLGSVVRKGTTNYKYAPYGQEIGGATANDTTKFATYTRDSLSGLDYALNRYYKPEWGRFTSPDPYQASGGPADPGSWNRYAYVGGDPVNWYDPPGLQKCRPGWICFSLDTRPFGSSALPAPNLASGQGGQDMYVPDEGSEDWHADLSSGDMDAALLAARDALADPDCAGIFNISGTGIHSPIEVLSHMTSGSPLSADPSRIIGRVGLSETVPVVAAAHAPLGPNGQWIDGHYFTSTANILINSRTGPGYWTHMSTAQRALTLIHELGHVFFHVTGLGGSRIVYDADLATGLPDPAAQEANRSTLEPCENALRSR